MMFRKHPSCPREHPFVSMESVDVRLDPELTGDNRDRLGHHLIIDLGGCNPDLLTGVDFVEGVLREAAKAAKATVVASKFHQFTPTGVSGALVLAESHITIHTWPEVNGYCAIDIFTCGPLTDNFAAMTVMKEGFMAKECTVVEIERGKEQKTDVPAEERWFREDCDPLGGFASSVKVKELLEEVTSPFQNIKMYDTHSVGKMMAIDGIIQYTDYDHFAYHEMIVHVPMQSHANPKKVLIIGGGDGGALFEVNKYKSVTEICICDIDEEVMKMAIKHNTDFAAAYKDPRVRAVFQDGAAFVGNFKDYFDVIVVDCTDFYGVAAPLARKSFYDSIHAALTADGVMVIQAESMYFDRNWIASLHKQCKEIFPVVSYYKTHVPTYPSGCIGFVYCSKKYNYMDMINSKTATAAASVRAKAANLPTPPEGGDAAVAATAEWEAFLEPMQYYTPEIHLGSFQLPKFMKKMLA
jgi:spermidine synthase